MENIVEHRNAIFRELTRTVGVHLFGKLGEEGRCLFLCVKSYAIQLNNDKYALLLESSGNSDITRVLLQSKFDDKNDLLHTLGYRAWWP